MPLKGFSRADPYLTPSASSCTYLCGLGIVLVLDVCVLLDTVRLQEGVEPAVASQLHLLQLIGGPGIHGDGSVCMRAVHACMRQQLGMQPGRRWIQPGDMLGELDMVVTSRS
jgi:hypothetical protein